MKRRDAQRIRNMTKILDANILLNKINYIRICEIRWGILFVNTPGQYCHTLKLKISNEVNFVAFQILNEFWKILCFA